MNYLTHKGNFETRAVYNVLGVNRDGYKDLIGMYISESEVAAARVLIFGYRYLLI
jgi:transposase-like protein